MHLLAGRTSGQFYRTPAPTGPSARVPLITVLIVVVLALAAGCSDDSDADGANDTRPAAGAGDGGGGGGGSGTASEYPAPYEPCDAIPAATISEIVGTDVTVAGIATGGIADGIETDGCTWTGADISVMVQVLAPPDPLAYLDGVLATTTEPVDDADLADLPDDARAFRYPGQPRTDALVTPDDGTLVIVGVVVAGEPDLTLASSLLLEVVETF
jgi:hypothetical protein